MFSFSSSNIVPVSTKHKTKSPNKVLAMMDIENDVLFLENQNNNKKRVLDLYTGI